MKLSKLYCNKPFKNVIFNTQNGKLNVILGDAEKKANAKDSHNLGKTRLILLIDFLLLKKSMTNFFLFKEQKKEGMLLPISPINNDVQYEPVKPLDVGKKLFEGYEFYLEILLNSGQFLTIKRTVNQSTKICFKLHNTTNKEFIFYQDWDYENIPIEKAQSLLNAYLNLDFCIRLGENYRRILNYSLRMQGDYDYERNSIFQLSKFRGTHEDWKPLMLALLGFDKTIAEEKYKKENDIKKKTELIKEQEKNFGVNPKERDSLVGKISVKEQEFESLQKELDNLNFYQQDKSIIDDLVGKIEKEIAELNNDLYLVEFDIKKLEQSIKNGFSFDLEKVKDLFEEVNIYFSTQLSKNYEQLIDFNRNITEERNKQISITLKEKELQRKTINTKLIDLNNQKEKFRDLIHDTSLFKKYSEYQRKVMKVEGEMFRLQNQIDALDEYKKKRDAVNKEKNEDLKQIIEQVHHLVNHTVDNSQYTAIRNSFSDIARKITNDTAYISLRLNTNDNIEFDCRYDDSAKAEGNSYYKLLCIAFDIALHTYYSTQSYFRFIYHDDAFANLANTRRMSLLKTIREFSTKSDFQYIFSIIKDDIPNSDDFNINADEIILTLHDRDVSGKLFLMDY